MPKPQKIPEIPEDLNLFEIPRKKPPAEMPPPAQVRGGGQHQSGGRDNTPVRTDQQAKYWEEKVKEHAAENLNLHQKLEAITKHRDQLLGLLSSQQQGNAALEETKAALEAETVNARQLEQQLAHLQQRIHELTNRVSEKEQDVTAARHRSGVLEEQLTRVNGEVARLKAELDSQGTVRESLVAELREQLAATKEVQERSELALRDQTAKARESAADLASLRMAHVELQRQCDEVRKSNLELGKRNNETDQRLADRVSEVQHLRGELDRRGTSFTDEFALRNRLREELRHEFNSRLTTEQDAAAAVRRQMLELQERLNDSAKELETTKREHQRAAAEREGAEAAIAKQLHASQAATDKAQTAYGKEATRANRLEKTLETLKQSRDELHEKLGAEKKDSAKAKRRIEQLEERVARNEESLKRAKAELEKRKRLGDGGTSESGDLAEMDLRVRDSVSALARATADLEAERRRLETAALQSRLPSLDATRVGQAFVNSFRSRLRPSADNLMHSIRGLLDLSLEVEQKRLAESALENALVIRAGLQEASLQGESAS